MQHIMYQMITLTIVFGLSVMAAWSKSDADTAKKVQKDQGAKVKSASVAWDDTTRKRWPQEFKVVKITSSVDGKQQPAYFLPAPQGVGKAPLVVSLHTWGGGYDQSDPLARLVQKEGWAYIHPHFRGPNRTTDACLSPQALADIDDAISYALVYGHADTNRVFVVGASGGGHATLGAYLRSRHDILLFLAWVPISDLAAWHDESLARGNKNYAAIILRCTSDGAQLDVSEARRRSPLYMEGPVRERHGLEIFAGINDGHDGSVPVSQSLRFFNRLARQYGQPEKLISEAEIADVMSRSVKADPALDKVGDRTVFLKRTIPGVEVTIFDGKHEMVVDACFKRMKEEAVQKEKQ